MTDYFCRRRIRLHMASKLLIYGGAVAFIIAAPWVRSTDAFSLRAWIGVSLPLVFFFGGFALWGLVGLLHTLAVYSLDESGIGKRHWNGSIQQFAWSDLVHVQAPRNGSMILTDVRGRRMSVAPPTYGYFSGAGRSLCQDLEERLASLAAGLEDQMAQQREYRFGFDATVIACGFLAFLSAAIAVSMPLVPPSSPSPTTFAIGMPVFFLCSAVFFASLAIRQATRTLLLTETSLIDRFLFRTREIPFREVVSVTTRNVANRSGTTEWTTVKSATTTVSFPSLLPNYDRLVQALQTRVGTQVAGNTTQASRIDARRIQQQTFLTLVAIGSLFGLGFGGSAVSSLHENQEALKWQTELDLHGRRTTGKVIGWEWHGNKNTSYYMQYAFTAVGQPFSHFSQIMKADYYELRKGARVDVTYLPDNPEVSRSAQATGKDEAERKIGGAKLMMGIGCALPILFGCLGFRHNARYRPVRSRNIGR